MSEDRTPWIPIIAVIAGIVLLIAIVFLQDKMIDAMKAPGRAVINAINGLLAGRPPWLK